jgi:hypothetical protein
LSGRLPSLLALASLAACPPCGSGGGGPPPVEPPALAVPRQSVPAAAPAQQKAAPGTPLSAPPLPLETVVQPPSVFPLHVSSTGRFLVDARGAPFRIQGEGAWSLIANLTAKEVDTYLEDRAAKGYNTVLVNLVEYRYAQKAPRNRAGDAPFRTAGDFSTPEAPYFDYAAAVVAKARTRGFLVLLVPAYLGYGCPDVPNPANEGWSAEMGHSPRASCRTYGHYVGERFLKFDNVVWVQGGDCMPSPGSALEACALAVEAGIQEAGGKALQTAHFSPNSTSLDEAAFASSIQLDAVYRYATSHAACVQAYARKPPLPAFLIESGYENERIQGTTPPTRKYLYWAALSCTAGVVSGSRPIWLFDEGWQAALDSPGANDVARLARLLNTLPWQALVPSGLAGMPVLVPSGGGAPGGQDEVAAAATPDGRVLVAYVPPGNGRGHRSFQVDARVLTGPATARFYNPWLGTYLPAGEVLPSGGPVSFTTPGDNGSGYDDWVLLLTRTTHDVEVAPPPRGPASR